MTECADCTYSSCTAGCLAAQGDADSQFKRRVSAELELQEWQDALAACEGFEHRTPADLRELLRWYDATLADTIDELEYMRHHHYGGGCGVAAGSGSGVGLVNDVIPPDRVEDQPPMGENP